MLTQLQLLFAAGDYDAAYWFCSAVAQSFAALTALTGVFAVYRLQLLRQDLREIVATLRDVMEKTHRAINTYVRRGQEPVHRPRVWHGEFAQRAIAGICRTEYLPGLQELNKRNKSVEFTDLEETLDDSLEWFEYTSSRARRANLLAAITIGFDALVTGAALVLVPLVPTLGVTALVISVVSLAIVSLAGVVMTAAVSIVLLA
jgi:VIT1/CCC1 family predicted Fe2+/Mn2+ transporter